MIRAVILTMGKEFRLVVRDRVGLFMLLIAPIVVIAAAGFSLSHIYGADPAATSGYVVAVVDEDHGAVARAVLDALVRDGSVRIISVADRDRARDLVLKRKLAVAAVIIPPSTSHAMQAGAPGSLILEADPVRYLETVRIELRLGDLCRAITAKAAEQVRGQLRATQLRIKAELDRAAAAAHDALASAVKLQHDADQARIAAEAAIRRQVDDAIALARARTEKALQSALDEVTAVIAAQAKSGQEALRPFVTYLAELRKTRAEFESWFAQLKDLAGGHNVDLPAPPNFPAPPPDSALAPPPGLDVAALRERLAARLQPPTIRIDLPKLPPAPKIALPPATDLSGLTETITMPGSLGFTEQDLGGAPSEPILGFNVFDLHVPGFGVTFLLIGMLMGVSLALIDEQDWGTLARLRSTSAPLSATLTGKLLARFLVGLVQMAVLFAAGWALFGISLGHQPAALLIPSAAIAFAGAALGLVVAGVARTRDAVLPIGAIAIMTMSAIGGCWWPIEFEPAWMREVARAFPTTWAMQAFDDLMIRRLPATSAIIPSLVNVGFGVVYAIIGGAIAQRRFAG